MIKNPKAFRNSLCTAACGGGFTQATPMITFPSPKSPLYRGSQRGGGGGYHVIIFTVKFDAFGSSAFCSKFGFVLISGSESFTLMFSLFFFLVDQSINL